MGGAGTVWLIGMMGAGKSTVGRRLAAQLGRAFVDTDAEIEAETGRSVAEIFAVEGEAAFRAREQELVVSLQGSGAVVAMGGGAPAQPAVRELLRGERFAVYLRASPEVLLERVGPDPKRPLLAGLSTAERLDRLRGLLEEREGAYATAGVVVDTDALDADQVAAKVMAALAPLLEGPDAASREVSS